MAATRSFETLPQGQTRTAMNKLALALAATLCLQTFCLLPRQTRAATPAPDERGVVGADTPDSDAFFQTALRRKTPPSYARRIDALLARMTLEEKVGQMTQLEIGMVTTGSDQTIRVDPEKLEKAVVRYGVGSVLNVKDQALSPDAWHEIIGRIQ